MASRSLVPNLVIAQRVIDKMVAAAEHFIEDETGEAMVGLVLSGKSTGGVPTIYVLDTISPDETAIRRYHTFQQGDDLQDEIIHWLRKNWQVQRKKRRGSYGKAPQAKWDTPLNYLGDWHKQPGYMIAPSGGDLLTALDWLDDPENEMEALLVPIVTLDHPPTTDVSTAIVNYITAPMGDGSLLRVDWWYIHRDARIFQPINPVIYPSDQLPGLTRYPWHLVDRERVETEFANFNKHNIFSSILLKDIDGQLPLEVCVTAARMGAHKIFLICTLWNYPQTPPIIRLAPFSPLGEEETIADVFDTWWEKSEPVKDPPGWQWSAEKTLLDYFLAVEESLGLRPATPDAPVDKAAAPTENGDTGGSVPIRIQVIKSEPNDED